MSIHSKFYYTACNIFISTMGKGKKKNSASTTTASEIIILTNVPIENKNGWLMIMVKKKCLVKVQNLI